MKILYKSRRYRFGEETYKKLERLKEYSIIESHFVRKAIEEKLDRDLPKLKIEKERVRLPF
jgi:hypothetical protein